MFWSQYIAYIRSWFLKKRKILTFWFFLVVFIVENALNEKLFICCLKNKFDFSIFNVPFNLANLEVILFLFILSIFFFLLLFEVKKKEEKKKNWNNKILAFFNSYLDISPYFFFPFLIVFNIFQMFSITHQSKQNSPHTNFFFTFQKKKECFHFSFIIDDSHN